MADAQTEDAPELPAADHWLGEIDAALKREKSFRDKGKKVVKRYRDERSQTSSKGDSRINILWSNTEVQKAALYSATAKPDVRRRFPDTPETTVISRTAAEIVERAVAYAIDVEDVDDPILSAVEDRLLPGRGVCWVSYEPSFDKDEYGVENITGQALCLDYVYWEDFCHGKGRQWGDVPWVARRHSMRAEEFKEKWPDARPAVPNRDYKLDENDSDDGEGDIEVWQIWDKPSKARLYVARGYLDALQQDEDPYQLSGFFPTPKPLYSVMTTDKLIPTAEFLQYQDQANELDRITTRKSRLTEQLKWKGIYDASIDNGENKLADLAAADDGDFLPYQNWQAVKDKGGIDAGVGFWPMERIHPVIDVLDAQANMCIQRIYEVTGVSDIMRGSSDPRETKGAQQLKAQFGSMRMQQKQKEVQRFIRDCYRIMAEIIAEHFTQETLAEITGMKLEQSKPLMGHNGGPPMGMPAPPPAMGAPPGMPAQPPVMAGDMPQQSMGAPGQSALPQDAAPTPEMKAQPKPTWDEVMQILRSDKLRSYRIDIETDQTAFQDAEEEKSKRIEFMQAVNDMLEKAYMAATNAPMMLPLIRETFMFAIRSFKAGRVMEQAAEDAFSQLLSAPPQQPQQDDGAAAAAAEEGRLALESKKVEQEGQIKMASLEIDKQDKAARLEMDREQLAANIALENKKLAASVAGQNKKILAEASEGIGDEESPDSMAPLVAVMDGIRQLAAVVAQSSANQGQQFNHLAQMIAAPKRVVRGADGKAMGVETVSIN